MENYKVRTNEKLSKLVGYLLILYTFFMLGRSIWINYQLNKETEKLNLEIEEAKIQNQNLENLILYYKSDSFREVEARKKLGLKKPGETVVAVPVSKTSNFQVELETKKQNISEKEDEEQISNWRLWWKLFFN
jgi:cell division protein FtsB